MCRCCDVELVMAATDLVLLSTLFCCCATATYDARFSALFPILSDDAVAQVGRSVVIPFSWAGTEPFQICRYARNDTVKRVIYIGGKIVLGDGFTVQRSNVSKHYELMISTIRYDHAGIYDLIVGENVASKKKLTVVSGPSCYADRSSDPHEAYYHCSVQHTGPAQPIMEWPALGECSETDTSNTYDTAGLMIRKSSCTLAVLHTNENMLRHSKECVLSFIDTNQLKLRQTYTCSTVMPQLTTYSHYWLDTSDRVFVRLGHIMYLILVGVSVFVIYCLRKLFLWMLVRLHKLYAFLLFNGHNSNGTKQDSSKLNTALQIIDS